jgi:hypothetical protein
MKKLLGLLCVGAMVAMMSGCAKDPTSATAPTITIDNIGPITAGTTKHVTGKVEAGEAITSITYAITDANGAAVTGVTVTGPTANNAKTQEFTTSDFILITVAATATNGSYKLKVSATASATADASFDFTVTGNSGTQVTVTTLATVGSNGAAAGSSMDLDAGAVYTTSQAASHVADLDLCYSYSAATSEDKLFTPSHAKVSGYNYAANWTNPPTTGFIKTSLTPTDFNAISTAQQIEALYTGTPVTTSAACVQGDVFVVKTTANAYVLILISAQTPGSAGTITVKMAK